MPNVRLGKKVLVISVVTLVAFLIIVGFINAFCLHIGIVRFASDTPEVSIGVSYNATANVLDLSVISLVNETLYFNQLAIISSRSNPLFTCPLSLIELPKFGNISFSVSIGNALLEGGNGYSVELLTSNGGKYVSSLILFEWISVSKVSLSSPKTLLVELHSLSNKTIAFDYATISQWRELRFSPDHNSLADIDVTEGSISPSEVLPNQNITLTVSLEKDLPSGNYSLKLHNILPEFVRGGERINFVANLERP